MTTNPPAGDPNPWSQPTSGYPDPTSGYPGSPYPGSGGGYQGSGYDQQPSYPPQGYQQPAGGWGGSPYAAAPQQTNGLATASLVVSIVAFVLCGGMFGIVGALMGRSAKKQIAATGEGGEGLATAGIIIGWIGFGLFLLSVVLFVALLAFGVFAASQSSGTTTY